MKHVQKIETYPDGTKVRDLSWFFNFINFDSLSAAELQMIKQIMEASYSQTRFRWRPSNCHDCAYGLLRYFRKNRHQIPKNKGLVLVSAQTNHSWIEIVSDSKTETRGDIILDPVGLWLSDNVPYFGKKEFASPSLIEQYMSAPGYRVETLNGRVDKTRDGYYWPWDEKHLYRGLQDGK